MPNNSQLFTSPYAPVKSHSSKFILPRTNKNLNLQN